MESEHMIRSNNNSNHTKTFIAFLSALVVLASASLAAPPSRQLTKMIIEAPAVAEESNEDIPGGYEPPPATCTDGEKYLHISVDFESGAIQNATLQCYCGAWYPIRKDVYDDTVCNRWGLMYQKTLTWMSFMLMWGLDGNGAIEWKCDVRPMIVRDTQWQSVSWGAGTCPLANGGTQPYGPGCLKMYDINKRMILYRTATYFGIAGNRYEDLEVIADDTDSYGMGYEQLFCSDGATFRGYKGERWGTITTNNLTSGMPARPAAN